MVIIRTGDLLKAKEDILVHQVNVNGIMGGGVAKQIATQYPEAEKQYQEMCIKYNNNFEFLKGKVDLSFENGKYIASIFSQDNKFNTNYEAMRQSLETVKEFAEQEGLSVAMPYKIGCGIANGEWDLVLDVINKVFKDSEVILYNIVG